MRRTAVISGGRPRRAVDDHIAPGDGASDRGGFCRAQLASEMVTERLIRSVPGLITLVKVFDRDARIRSGPLPSGRGGRTLPAIAGDFRASATRIVIRNAMLR
jgi:hypothetical protein